MGSFLSYNPYVLTAYFCAVVFLSMYIAHPVFLLLSLVFGLICSVRMKGRFSMWYMLWIALVSALFNPLFNRQGTHIVGHLPWGGAVTAESLWFGLTAALMLCAALCWFSCFGVAVSSEKLAYVFGSLAPSTALTVSMSMRLVPRFKRQFDRVREGQLALGYDLAEGSPSQRVALAGRILRIVAAWSFEDAVDTADSMKARGYGLKGRTSFSRYRMTGRDWGFLCLTAALFCGVLWGCAQGAVRFQYFPVVDLGTGGLPAVCSALSYTALLSLPLLAGIPKK